MRVIKAKIWKMKKKTTQIIIDVFEPENAMKPTIPNWQKYFVGIVGMNHFENVIAMVDSLMMNLMLSQYEYMIFQCGFRPVTA